MRLEFFFDCSSPWTYLAFAGIQPLAARVGVSIEWKPILVGGVFNSVNPEVYSARANPNPRRMDHMRKDLQDWARLAGLTEQSLPQSMPAGVEAISSDEVVADIARGVGLDERAFMAAIARPACKERLRANTDELIERGGFGTPTMFVNGSDMYFGNDRLVLVEHALLGRCLA